MEHRQSGNSINLAVYLKILKAVGVLLLGLAGLIGDCPITLEVVGCILPLLGGIMTITALPARRRR